nr:retrovirus-related Pol polyprotein from transposon TNT 1-94 [Tanacetum cinerariifolium]
MDSGGSFHMTPRRDFLFDFKEYGGTVLLSDNRACIIMGIGKLSFGRGQHTTEEVIDYVHVNLWGPSRVESSGCWISRHFIVAGTPQQNGLAEPINRTLLNKVRCLLIQSGLPDSFWDEATMTAVYLINRSPSTALEKKTPMDLWDVVFNESLMYKDTLKGASAVDSGKEVEFEVELQGSRVKPTVDPHTGENPGNKDEEQDEEP